MFLGTETSATGDVLTEGSGFFVLLLNHESQDISNMIDVQTASDPQSLESQLQLLGKLPRCGKACI